MSISRAAPTSCVIVAITRLIIDHENKVSSELSNRSFPVQSNLRAGGCGQFSHNRKDAMSHSQEDNDFSYCPNETNMVDQFGICIQGGCSLSVSIEISNETKFSHFKMMEHLPSIHCLTPMAMVLFCFPIHGAVSLLRGNALQFHS